MKALGRQPHVIRQYGVALLNVASVEFEAQFEDAISPLVPVASNSGLLLDCASMCQLLKPRIPLSLPIAETLDIGLISCRLATNQPTYRSNLLSFTRELPVYDAKNKEQLS